jgi:hypothetical protein
MNFSDLEDLVDTLVNEIANNPSILSKLETKSDSRNLCKSLNWVDSIDSNLTPVPNPEGRNFLF